MPMERSTTTCPCAADMPGAEDMPVPGFRNDRRWGFSSERLGITFHGNTLTHVDSPCHISRRVRPGVRAGRWHGSCLPRLYETEGRADRR
jgi:hypothetical protein